MLVVFAGEIACGKTTLARRVAEALGVERINTGKLLRKMHPGDYTRPEMQKLGRDTESQDRFWWLPRRDAVVDSIRKSSQVATLRLRRPTGILVYLHCSPEQLAKNYAARGDVLSESVARSDSDERRVKFALAGVADVRLAFGEPFEIQLEKIQKGLGR